VFSGLSDFKQKKESAQFSVLCGILEIHNAIVITSGPAFAVLIDWIGKVQRSLETALFEDKKRKKKKRDGLLVGRVLSEWLPRYCAIEYVKNGCTTSGPGCRELLGLCRQPGNWQTFLSFMKHICRGFPIPVQQTNIRDTLFPILSKHFVKILGELRDMQSILEIEVIVEFLAMEVGIPQMQTFRMSTQSLEELGFIVSTLLKVVASQLIADIWQTNLVSVSAIEAANLIHQIATAFQFTIKKVLRRAAPALSIFPLLVFRFLCWSRDILAATFRKGGLPEKAEIDELIGVSLILLRSVSPKSLLISADQILREMASLYADPNQFIFPVHRSIGCPTPGVA
jgi:hypothetical protein